MSIIALDPPTMTRGDLKPDLTVDIGDALGIADFSAIDETMVQVSVVQGTVALVLAQPTAFTPSDDGKTARVVRAWEAGETDAVGRCWVNVIVAWPAGKPQHFPEDTPLRLDIRPAPGDA